MMAQQLLVDPEPRELARLSEATRMLAQAETLDEIKQVRDLAASMALYAREQKLGEKAQNHAAAIKIRAEAKAGRLLTEQAKEGKRKREHGGRPKMVDHDDHNEPTLDDLGITKQQSSDWQAEGKLTDAELDDHIAENSKPGREVTTKGTVERAKGKKLGPHTSSATPEWTTPPEIIERVLAVFEADIDLDPCAEPACAVPAAEHYTEVGDGLAHEWHGRVYMNPPYGDEIAGWVDKLIHEYQDGDIEQAIALVPARTDTQWFRRLWDASAHVCFIAGRLRFSGHDNSAPFPSALAYLGERYVRFTHVMRDLGLIAMDAVPWDQEEVE